MTLSPEEAAALVRYLDHLHAIGVGRGRAVEALRELALAGLLSDRGSAIAQLDDLGELLGIARGRGAPRKVDREAIERAIAEYGSRSEAALHLGISERHIRRVLSGQK